MTKIVPQVASPPPRRLLGVWDGSWVVALVLLWLLPIFYVGSFDRDVRSLPVYLRHQQRIAALFTESVKSWSNYHIEVKRTGKLVLEELPEAGYFDKSIFGYRTRLHRILGSSARSSRGRIQRRQMKELAEYIHRRHRIIAPHEPPFEEVRFVRSWLSVEALARQEGHYVKPRLGEVPPRSRRVLSHFRFDDEGRAIDLDLTGREPRRRR